MYLISYFLPQVNILEILRTFHHYLFLPGLDGRPLPPPPALAVKVLDSWITPATVYYIRASAFSLPLEQARSTLALNQQCIEELCPLKHSMADLNSEK